MVELSRRGGRILQVGHLERFNPAIRSLAGVIAHPRFIECHRLAPFVERGTEVDVILDLVGGPYAAGNLAALAPRGRWIVVGVPGGQKAEIDLRALMRKRASIRGTVLRARPLAEKIDLTRAFRERVSPHVQSGAIQPVIDRTYAPEEVAAAHTRMEANRNFGKIIITW